MEMVARISLWIGSFAVVTLLALEIRHTDRYGKDRGPMPARLRNFLIYIIGLAILGMMPWNIVNNWVW